jgi:hypothetical protein
MSLELIQRKDEHQASRVVLQENRPKRAPSEIDALWIRRDADNNLIGFTLDH